MSEKTNEITGKDLFVPVYIDTSALLDILASIQDGFSLVHTETKRSSSTESVDRNERSLNAEFTIPNFLKIAANPAKSLREAGETGSETTVERYHTYGSLFHQFRQALSEFGMLKHFDGSESSWNSLQPADFVELRGIFKPHPFVEWFTSANRMLTILTAIQSYTIKDLDAKQKALKATKGPSSHVADLSSITSNLASAKTSAQNVESLQNVLETFRTDLDKKELQTFVLNIDGDANCAVLAPLFVDYMRDKTAGEVTNKAFTLMGKVIQKNTSEPISLLYGTGLGGLATNVLTAFATDMNKAGEGTLNLPELVVDLPPPSLQVIPIAVYA